MPNAHLDLVNIQNNELLVAGSVQQRGFSFQHIQKTNIKSSDI